jgi:hypothetical protein
MFLGRHGSLVKLTKLYVRLKEMENLKLCYMIIMLYYYLDKSTCIIVALIWYSRFVLYRIVFLIKKREINEIFFREGAYD